MNITLPTMYHGTSRRSWRLDEENLPLHLTQNREDAVDYANESRDNWLLDYSEADHPDGSFDAIIVEFTQQALESLLSSGRIRLAPTQGCEQLRGVKDWKKAFDEEGALRLEGFENSMKTLGVITAATTA